MFCTCLLSITCPLARFFTFALDEKNAVIILSKRDLTASNYALHSEIATNYLKQIAFICV